MKLAAVISSAALQLAAAGVDEPRREAAALAAFVTRRDRTFIFAHPEYELSERESADFAEVLRRRAAREPFHYITGVKEFYGLEFRVGPGVLIPRPETELLVEEAIAELGHRSQRRVLEIGVGSGCISVAILKNTPDARADGVDVSSVAIETARLNAEAHGVADRLDIRAGRTYAGAEGPFDLIVSNPPYIPERDRSSLMPDVAGFEPAEALFGGEDGLSVVREIVAGAPARLVPGGRLLMEIGIGQSAAVRELLGRSGLAGVEFIRDLQGIDRVASARR